jgi:DNA-binding LacI/PurR family transcriptional regulator
MDDAVPQYCALDRLHCALLTSGSASCVPDAMEDNLKIQIPARHSLVSQTKAIVQQHIQAGTWGEYLPSEAELCKLLQISRITVRAALAELVAEKVVSSGRGQRRQILRRPKGWRSTRTKRVVLLTPIPFADLTRFELYWIDEVRENLGEAGYHLEVRMELARLNSNPRHALEELRQRLNPGGWVLLQSTRAAQQWFSTQGELAVIAGSRHPGVNLPFVDVDYRALCRHAAGRLLARGHRRLAFLSLNSGLAGDLESEQGFWEATQQSSSPATAVVLRHNRSPEDLSRRMTAMLGRPDAPTGFLVSKAYHALTAIGCLRRRGLRVPEDVSIISRDSEPYLAHTVPPMTCYAADPAALARNISRSLISMISSGTVINRECRIMPQFIAGGTLAKPQTRISARGW